NECGPSCPLSQYTDHRRLGERGALPVESQGLPWLVRSLRTMKKRSSPTFVMARLRLSSCSSSRATTRSKSLFKINHFGQERRWSFSGGSTGARLRSRRWRGFSARTTALLRDKPILIESYVDRQRVEEPARLQELLDFARRMGRETRQA